MRDLHEAVAHANAGRWMDAQMSAERALALQPREPSALNVLGLVAMNTGRPSEAIVSFEKAAAGQPKNPFIQYNLGEAHRRVGTLGGAAAAFARAARLKPDFAEAVAAAGDALRGLGRTGEAEAHYRKALRIAPTSPAALNGYGLLRLARGEPREAVVDELAVGLATGNGRGADRDLRRAPDPRGQLLVGVGEPLELVGLCANQAVSRVHFADSFLGDDAAVQVARSQNYAVEQ